MSEPLVKIETITPEIAKKMLAKNSHNRNLSQKSLDHYVRQIEEGQWELNGDTIKFANDDTLLDGQHRLHAIMATKKPMKCIVVRGLSKSVMPTIDTGRSRTVADHLKLQNRFAIGSYTATGAAIGICWRFRKGVFVDTRERMTPSEAIAFIEQNPSILKSADLCGNLELVRMTTPSVAIACHYLFCKIDKFRGQEFFDRLQSGENLGKTSPILKLRTQLHAMRSDTKRVGIIARKQFLYYMVEAFGAYLHGKRIEDFEKMTTKTVIELPKRGGG